MAYTHLETLSDLSVDATFENFGVGGDIFLDIFLDGVEIATNDGDVALQLGYGSGLVSSGYHTSGIAVRAGSGSEFGFGGTNASRMLMVSVDTNLGLGNAANELFSGWVRIPFPQATGLKRIFGAASYEGPNGDIVSAHFAGMHPSNTGALDAIGFVGTGGFQAGRADLFSFSA